MKNPLALLSLLCATAWLVSGCALKDKIFPPPSTPTGESAATTAAAATPAPTPVPVAPAAVEPEPKSRRPLLAYLWPPNWYRMLFPPKTPPPQALPPQVIGEIRMVNSEDRFVLIDAVSFGNIEPGTQFLCLADRRKTATLEMSALKNPPFLIADIVSGHPSPGDKVIKP